MAGPTSPPVGTRFSTGEDLYLLNGPTSAPPGAVVVSPGGTGLDTATFDNAAGTTFYLLGGTHHLGTPGSPTAFDQVIPKDGNTYIGAPGAILHGQGVNYSAFTQHATDVTVQYLEVTGFVAPIDEFVVNHDSGDDWTIEYCNFHDNGGAALGMGSGATVRYCWLHDNGQYGFSSYKPPIDDGNTPALVNVTLDHCEIAYNGTLSDEIKPDGTGTGNGRNGGGKFWNTTGITVTSNWVHHSNWVGIWVDTSNIACQFDGNLLEYNTAEAFMYEISYNFSVTTNTFRYNTIYLGFVFAAQGNGFPCAAVYISEAGGDSNASETYAACAISGNTFLNNWDDISLWENSNRFYNSPANTASTMYRPRNAGNPTLAVCNSPTPNVLTVTLTAGSPDFTVTGGTFQSTDEGRPASGAGIPAGTLINYPNTEQSSGPYGYLSPTQGVLTQNATITGTSTITLAAGTINVDPAYSACRWHTQNITISNNTFGHNSAAVLAGATLPSGVVTGKIALFSEYGTYPGWSPYQAFAVSDLITFHQNNVWSDNAYQGDYTWLAHDTDILLTFAEWQAAPYSQDVGSTFDPTPPGNSFSASVSDSAPLSDGVVATVIEYPRSLPTWTVIDRELVSVSALYTDIGNREVRVTRSIP